MVYFGSFGVEHVPEEIKEFARNKNIIAKIFRVLANTSVMCVYFWIGFTDFMLAGKIFTAFISLFSSYDGVCFLEKNGNMILSYFKEVDKINLTHQKKIRLNEITEIEN